MLSFVTFFLHFIKTHSRVLLFKMHFHETAGSPSPLSLRKRKSLSPTLDFLKYSPWGWSRNLCLHEISWEFLCPEQWLALIYLYVPKHATHTASKPLTNLKVKFQNHFYFLSSASFSKPPLQFSDTFSSKLVLPCFFPSVLTGAY